MDALSGRYVAEFRCSLSHFTVENDDGTKKKKVAQGVLRLLFI
jgi:hypothetical protein